jgi:hypothetical protein
MTGVFFSLSPSLSLPFSVFARFRLHRAPEVNPSSAMTQTISDYRMAAVDIVSDLITRSERMSLGSWRRPGGVLNVASLDPTG